MLGTVVRQDSNRHFGGLNENAKRYSARARPNGEQP